MFQLRRAACSAVAGVALAAVSIAVPTVASAAPAGERTAPSILGSTDAGVIKDSYIVVFKDTTVTSSGVDAGVKRLAAAHGATVSHTYRGAVRGFAATMSAAQAAKLATEADVAYVEQNRTVRKSADTIQYDVQSWGLDRLDQIFAPLNKRFTYPNTAGNVRAYVVDSGIRISHREFAGRASHGYDFIDNDTVANDCDGHGTHVAGTIGGSNYGVAKGVKLIAVRILDCEGSGTLAQSIAALEWVTANAVKPAVVNMSFGLDGYSATLDGVVQGAINSGLTVAAAAGNDNANACDFSPGRGPDVITVGATDEVDFRTSFSNWGSCVDINAPGHHIPSSVATSDTAIAQYSGTSMASPHVAGAAALALSANPTWTNTQVRNHLVYGGTRRVVRNTAATATTDVMLRIGTNAVPQVTGLRSLTNGKNVSAGTNGSTPLKPTSAPVTMGDAEKFTIATGGTGYITFSSWANGRYVTGGSGSLVASASTVTDAERFQVVMNGDGTTSLRNKLNGRYVTAPSNGTAPLVASATTIGTAEKFIWASPTAVVVLRSATNGKLVTTPNTGSRPLIASATAAGQWEKFDMLDYGADVVAFRAHSNRKFVMSPAGGTQPLIANSTSVGAAQQFWYYHYGDGSLLFQSTSSYGFVQAPNGGTQPLKANYDLSPDDAIVTSAILFTYQVLKVG